MKKNILTIVCLAAVMIFLGSAFALAASPAVGDPAIDPSIIPPSNYSASTSTGWKIISYSTVTDEKGNVISKSGTETFGGKDLEGHTYSGFTNLSFNIIGGTPELKQTYTETTTSGKTTSGADFSRVDKTTVTNDLSADGKLTGGTQHTDSVETDTNNGVASTITQSSNSTQTEVRNGQLLVLASSGTTTITDKDGKQVDSGTNTVNSVYGDYSGGKWNMTSSTQTSHDSYNDGESKNTTLTTTMTYNANGTIASQSATGTVSGKEMTNYGLKDYTGTITITYDIKNGVAVQGTYTEPHTYL